MRRFSYPHTIDNGAGERLTFLRWVPSPAGDRIEGYNVVAPGAGPMMHVHHYQAESFTVRRGLLAYQRLGEAPQYAEPGESVTFLPGEAHRFWNAGETDLECAAYVEPADNVEYFLSEMFASQKRSGKGRPNPFDAAYLALRYRSEFAMTAIPALVQRLVFPVLVAIGTMLGLYGKYPDAPEPVRR